MSQNSVRKMISVDQFFSAFDNIRGTPKYLHNMLLDVLAKIKQFGVYAFLTCSFVLHLTEIIKVVVRQYGETLLTDEEVNVIDWSTKVNYLKRSRFTIAR